MNLLLGIVIALAGLAGLIWMLVRFVSISTKIIRGIWGVRSGLNPTKVSGLWRLLGALLILLGILLVSEWFNFHLLDDLLVRLQWMDPDQPMSWSLKVLFFISGFAVAWLGFLCLRRAQQYEAPSANKVLAEDPRAPVLYLRSFEDDSRVARRIEVSGFALGNEESVIAEIFNTVGPLIAIGKPGEVIPYAGAARKYVGQGDWQACVRDLMLEARLVILRAGNTKGLWWEIAESAKHVRPEKLIFLIPLKRPGYEEFRRKAESYLPCRLPDYQGWRIPVTTIRAVLFFDADWASHLLPIQETVAAYWLDRLASLLTGELSVLRNKSLLREILENTFRPILKQKLRETA